MDEDFGVNFGGNFDSLAKDMADSSLNEFKKGAQQAFDKIKDSGGTWSMDSKSDRSFQFTGDPDAITREFGTATGSGTYAVSRAMRSVFGGSIQYEPSGDHELFQRALSDTPSTKGVIAKTKTVGSMSLNTEKDRRAILKSIVLKKAASTTNNTSIDVAMNSLFKNMHFSRFQKSIYALLVWEGGRYWGLERQQLRYQDALIIQGMMLLTPSSLVAWKESLFLTVLSRALHQGAKQDIFNVNAYSMLLDLVSKTEIIGKGGRTIVEGSLPTYAQKEQIVVNPGTNKYTDAQGFVHNVSLTQRNILDFEKQGRIKGGGIVGRARIKQK
jgi:hypothetical protein